MVKVGSMKKRRAVGKLEVTMRNEEKQGQESNHTSLEDVPCDVIKKILVLLPTKACLHCKLVCKGWYAIITSHEFTNERRAHGGYASLLLQGSFHGRARGKEFVLLDLDKSSKIDEEGNLTVVSDLAMLRIKPKLKAPIANLDFVNECNGLICMKTSGYWSPFIIFNLLTGQQLTVKQTYVKHAYVYRCGFGYSAGLDDDSGQFKVLRTLMSSKAPRYFAEILTLGTDEWRSVGEVPATFHLSGAFLQGSLHWYSDHDNSIWSFNFGKEKFSLVPLSDELETKQILGVSIFDSCLCCKVAVTTHSHEFWVMKEYGKKDSWVKQFSSVYTKGYGMPFLKVDDGKVMLKYEESKRIIHGEVLDLESDTSKRLRIFQMYPAKALGFCASFRKFQLMEPMEG